MRTWSGVARMRIDVTIELMQLDFPAPGGAGDQEVGHRGEVEHHGLPGDVAAQSRLRAGCGRLLRVLGGEEVAQGHELALTVRDLDADRAAPRDRGEDAHVG